ncbi:MAG: D-aminoacyl-tRNA deacylase [Actinomycetota bacterium]
MRAVVQRVSRAAVTVDGEVVGSIEHGLCVLVGVTHDDSEAQAIKLAERLWKLRIFTDSEGKMNRSVADVAGSVLIISQFTLYGDARKGNRPSYVDAARPEVAEPLVQRVVDRLTELGAPVATGRFGADMSVDLVNDGPVTISLELSASS